MFSSWCPFRAAAPLQHWEAISHHRVYFASRLNIPTGISLQLWTLRMHTLRCSLRSKQTKNKQYLSCYDFLDASPAPVPPQACTHVCDHAKHNSLKLDHVTATHVRLLHHNHTIEATHLASLASKPYAARMSIVLLRRIEIGRLWSRNSWNRARREAAGWIEERGQCWSF